jgi:tetratricopeptide (TPR) repeat protein
MTTAPPAAAQDIRNADDFAEWCRSQGLVASYNPPSCDAAASSGEPGTDWERAPTREEIEARNQARAERRQARERKRQARVARLEDNARYAEIARVWKQAEKLTSARARGQAYRNALELARRQQAIRGGASLQDFVGRVETLILWTDGVIADEDGRYQDAVFQLYRAEEKNPSLFGVENRRYMSDVHLRWRGTFRQGVVATFPPPEVRRWNGLRLSLPEEVGERVRAGFHALEAGDWAAARAWFEDALSRDPDNARIRSYLEVDPETVVGDEPGVDSSGQPLPESFTLETLQDHAMAMSDEQISRALFEIVMRLRLQQATVSAAGIAASEANAAAFEASVVPLPESLVFRPAGKGLVGGTGARFGYYSPAGASPEVRARALEMLRDQDRVAGRNDAGELDLEHYNFAVGVANAGEKWDLASRVLREQLHNGQFTASSSHQDGYNRLRGRQFDELGCHSNGAMTCLAALVNRDVQATDVVLYGPQITVESLAMWNKLLADEDIKSLRIVVAENDPVPVLSLLTSPVALSSPQSASVAAALSAPLLADVGNLRTAIALISPDAAFSTFSCKAKVADPTHCHVMARYSDHSRRCRRDRLAVAAGKRSPGGRSGRAPVEAREPDCP